MTRIATAMASLLLFAGAGLAQVREIRYPQLAAAARVQGDVRLRSVGDGWVPISGPPLLVQTAMASMKALGTLSDRTEAEVVIHFALIEPTVREVTVAVKKGDAFDRLILRVLGVKTEKTIKRQECHVSPELPENRIDSTKAPIEVWIFGRIHCVMVESLGIATD
jgi:hypothetical protein